MEKRPDIFLLLCFFLLLLFGILAISTSSAPFSQTKFGDSFYYVKRQIILGLIPGFIVFLFFYKMNLNYLKRYSIFFILTCLFLTVLVFVPDIGVKIKGGARWIDLGPITFQPSEFLKLAFITYLASWLHSKIGKEKDFSKAFFVFLLILTILSLILLSQPDMSTLLVILSSAILMFFISRTPLRQTIFILLLLLLVLIPLIKYFPYRLVRILTFLNPDMDPLGVSYQINQSLIAVGSGGLFGKGLGLSEQKMGFLPLSFSDTIFSIFAEEMGFLGSVFLISLYLLLFFRSYKIGIKEKDEFRKLLCFGISFWFYIQFFVNIGSMIGILPLTGIPLPFISYGGSHLIAEMGAMGILLNISKK